MRRTARCLVRTARAGVALATIGGLLMAGPGVGTARASDDGDREQRSATATPIHHLVIIFQENVSFDHYFATYPHAENRPGEPTFNARPDTPRVDNLLNAGLLSPNNPNSAQPFRLPVVDRRVGTCDQNHEYRAEQDAFDDGRMDKFVEFVGVGSAPASPCTDYGKGPSLVMGYFDGNTVTALWNYAQFFAMNDNSFNTTFGPSTPGAVNLIAGQTHGAVPPDLDTPFGPDTVAGSVIGDPQPIFDDCSTRETVMLTGRSVGDLLNAKGVTWGFFQGGFKPSTPDNATTGVKCDTAHIGSNEKPKKDYIPHHEPFQYYASTANPHHLRPSSIAMIGETDQANHQYDLVDFWAAAESGQLPAVSVLKARGFEDGHADYSDPLAEQRFLVQTLNGLQQLPQWEHMAVVITYDDSDGWYDHVPGPIVNHSQTIHDAALCNGGAPSLGRYQGRCGHGPRVPLLVISPFAKENYVDHTVTDTSSILRFIEDNWRLGRIGDQSFDAIAGSLMPMFDFEHRRASRLLLDPTTGQRLTEDD